MATRHTIRLRGPWGCEPLARFEGDGVDPRRETSHDLPVGGRLTMPSDWSPICGANFRGRVRLRRRFHWPTRLTPRERVWLVFDEISGAAVVRLNEDPLGEFATGQAPAEYDITDRLEATNVLLVEVTWPLVRPGEDAPPHHEAAGGLTGEVRLEVRS